MNIMKYERGLDIFNLDLILDFAPSTWIVDVLNATHVSNHACWLVGLLACWLVGLLAPCCQMVCGRGVHVAKWCVAGAYM